MNAADEARERERRGWHVGREIPLALILALIVQTGMGIRWISKLESSIESAALTSAETKAALNTVIAQVNSPVPAIHTVKITTLERDVASLQTDVRGLREQQMRQRAEAPAKAPAERAEFGARRIQ